MPKMVKVEVNSGYKPESAEDAKSFKALKDTFKGVRTTAYATAMENIRNSKGMLRLVPEGPEKRVQVMTEIEDMSSEQLKVMMASLGIKTQKKQMRRSDVIDLIRARLKDVDIVEDEEIESAE